MGASFVFPSSNTHHNTPSTHLQSSDIFPVDGCNNSPTSTQQNRPRESECSSDDILHDPTDWTTSMVAMWLDVQMQEKDGVDRMPTQCIRRLTENLVDGKTVGSLSRDDWSELIPLMGMRAHVFVDADSRFCAKGAGPCASCSLQSAICNVCNV